MVDNIGPKAQGASDYELIGRRLQRLIAAPEVQKVQWVLVTRRDDEPVESWERVLGEIEETEGIQVERLEDATVRIGWKRYIDN